MVCKDEVFIWFKTLKAPGRLEIMCGLLNMCYPLEVRFFATFAEDLLSRDYKALKEDEGKANTVAEVLKFKNVFDPLSRSRLLLSLTLLHTSNLLCALEIYNILSKEINVDAMVSADVFSNPKCVDEILLLLTMAQNHPAFNFQQQNYLTELCSAIEDQQEVLVQEKENTEKSQDVPPVNLIPVELPHVCPNTNTCYISDECDEPADLRSSFKRACITNLRVRPPHKKPLFRIRVSYAEKKSIHIYKSSDDFIAFHKKMLHFFPDDVICASEKFIPEFPDVISASCVQEIPFKLLADAVNEYVQQLMQHLPDHIFQHDYFLSFFSKSRRGNMAKCGHCVAHLTCDVPKNQKPDSRQVCNSHISEGLPVSSASRELAHVPGNQPMKSATDTGYPTLEVPNVPQNSPIISPNSSPYVSPTNSVTNSRPASPWIQRNLPEQLALQSYAFEKLLIKENLHGCWELLRTYKMDEILSMPQEILESLGISKEDGSKIRKILDGFKFVPNGVSSHIITRSASSAPSYCISSRNASNVASPVCSEYPSPSQSPPVDTVISSSEDSEKAVQKTSDSSMGHVADCSSYQDPLPKRQEETSTFQKNVRENRRPSVSSMPFPASYGTSIIHVGPMHSHKPFIPMQCRTNAGIHLAPGGMVYDGQFPRIPSQSALTIIPLERNLTPNAGLPITTLCPFPVVTSGCNTVPSATCSFVNNKGVNITTVTSSVASMNGNQTHQFQKLVQSSVHDSEVLPKQPAVENMYAVNCGYLVSPHDTIMRTNSASNCPCISTSSITQPSQSSISLTSTPQPTSSIPVTMPYVGLPYVFPPHSFPFLQGHSGGLANGYIQPANIAAGHSFTYAMPNGLSHLTPDMYGGPPVFSPSPATSPLLASPVSPCYGTYAQMPSGMTVTHAVKFTTCYNCGRIGHRGAECTERICEDNPPGKFPLNISAAANAKPLETQN